MLSGSIVALVTPMTIDGKVDWRAMDDLLEWHIEMGTAGIVPVGQQENRQQSLWPNIARLLSM